MTNETAKTMLTQAIKLSPYGMQRSTLAAKRICVNKCDKNWVKFIELVEDKMSWDKKSDTVTKIKEYIVFCIEKEVA